MASQNKPKRKGWPKVGTIRKNDGGSYLKLEDNVEILVDGQKIPLNKSRTLNFQDPRKNVEAMRDKGIIDEKTAEERLEKLSTMDWLKYEVIAAPPKAE